MDLVESNLTKIVSFIYILRLLHFSCNHTLMFHLYILGFLCLGYNSCVYPRVGDGSIRGDMNKYVTSMDKNGSECFPSLYLSLFIIFISYFFCFPYLRIM